MDPLFIKYPILLRGSLYTPIFIGKETERCLERGVIDFLNPILSPHQQTISNMEHKKIVPVHKNDMTLPGSGCLEEAEIKPVEPDLARTSGGKS